MNTILLLTCCESWINSGINLLISIFGSAITMWVAYIWKFRHLLDKSTFLNQKSAEKDIIKEIRKSKELRVFAMCASTFSDTAKSKIAENTQSSSVLKQFYLISDLNSEHINKRQNELPLDKVPVNLQSKVEKSIIDLKAQKKSKNENLYLRLHKEQVGFRLIILKQCLYISQQEPNKYGKDSEVKKIKNTKPDYRNYLNYFEDLWNYYENSEIKQ